MKNKNSVEMLLKIIYAIDVLICICAFYFFGASLQSTKHSSELFELKNQFNTNERIHITTTSQDESFSIDAARKLCLNLYSTKQKVRSCYSVPKDTKLEYLSFESNVGIYTVPVYSDEERTEFLRLPLYNTDYIIKYGPRFGAKFASYLPSSLAEQLVYEFHYSSFDELLDQPIVYSVKIDSHIYSFSINNIYYDADTDFWHFKNSEDGDEYFDFFSKWNKNAIFSYCNQVFKDNGTFQMNYDVENSYSNIDSLIKTTVGYSGETDFKFYKTQQNYISKQYSQNSYVDTFDSFDQITCYIIACVSLISLFAIIIFSKPMNRSLIKTSFLLVGFISFTLIISEILKSAFPTNMMLYIVFNSIGNVSVLIMFLVLFLLLLLFEKDVKNVRH